MNYIIFDLETGETENIYIMKHILRIGDKINLKTSRGVQKHGIVRNVVWSIGTNNENITFYVKFNEPINYLQI